MTPELQTTLSVAVPTLAVLIGILVNNARLGDLNARIGELPSHFDQRIDDMQQIWRSELRRVEEVLDARLTNLGHRMAHLEERLG
jgi:hypothetical protein